MTEREAIEQNRRIWDAAVAPHAASAFYDVEGFLAGRGTLDADLIDELGPLDGLTLVHLQCHFGLDTLSLARRGARVTGVDFSPAAVAKAREIAARAGLEARFVEAELGQVPERLPETFDLVFTGGGALCWLPDLEAWGRVVAGLLKPGGRLLLRDFHPALGMFAPEERAGGWLRLEAPYFRAGGPAVWTDGLVYASEQGPVGETVEWAHGIGEVVQALLDAGLVLERLREYPYCSYRSHSFLVEREGRWVHPSHPGGLPLMMLVQARRPA
ncbi:MAG: class I SAM-dependent methyltransferase [bacterium]|nr:class I SAM-dependent methyltransferase [bacterium]